MQTKIFIFVPINIRRNLESLLRRKAPNTKHITPLSSSEELKYFADIFENPVKEKLPEEGAIVLPEMIFMRNNTSAKTIEVAKDLFEKSIQRFFSPLGTLIPVIE